ncbi:MAG: sodium:solute symporter family protein [Proteobacteria bacterium]|nr:sodium:solute symporter family protein [Pseudomonadota bacterium]
MSLELAGISLYVLSMLVLGYVVSKRIKSDSDYFLAGRSLGPFLATFSIFATWFGAETCIGTAGKVMRSGISGTHADPFGYALCILLMGYIFARLIWKKQITTVPDLFRERYGVKAERLAAIILIPSSLVWGGAQIRAFGQIIHTTTDAHVTLAITIAAAVVIIYTISGGLLADAYTDLIQGFALIVGLVVLFVAIVWDLGGVSAAWSQVKPESLNFLKLNPDEGENWWQRFELWLVPILGSLMSQEIVSRVAASRSETVAAESAKRAGWIYLCVGIFPVGVGLLGHVYHPELADTDGILPLLAREHLNLFFYIIFVGALVSAILSTVDSTLLAVSALATHNLIYPTLPNLSEKKKIFLARTFVFLSGLVAYGIAFTSDSVTGLVETASSLGGPSILVMSCFALFTKTGNSWSAICAMSASIVAWFLGHFVWQVDAPVLLTVATCLSVYLLSLLWIKKES